MNWLEIIGTAVGLVYLYLEYKASIWLWIAGIVMPAIYVVVYYQAGLYADVGINIYYLLAAFYGLWVWFRPTDKKSDSQNQLGITHLPKKHLPAMAALTLILTVAFALLLDHATDSTVPWADSFTTALSIIGMWMLAKKYIEQWWVWGIVDFSCALLYVYKELYFTAGLYALYTVIVFFGYRKWKQLLLESQNPLQ